MPLKKHRIQIDLIRRNVIKHMKSRSMKHIVYNQFLTL